MAPHAALSQSSYIRFCNKGDEDFVYRSMHVTLKSVFRDEVTIASGACGPREVYFPTAYAFFHRNRAGDEYNLVYGKVGTQIEAPEHLQFESACFNPNNPNRESVSRGIAEEYWLGDECSANERRAKISFVIQTIRGSGSMTYNVAKRTSLPIVPWIEGSSLNEENNKSASANPESLDLAAELFGTLLSSAELPPTLQSFDYVRFSDLPGDISLSRGTNPNVSAMIGGRNYGVSDFIRLARNSVYRQFAYATEVRFKDLHFSPLLLRTDEGGHVLVYPDIRKSRLIIAEIEPGMLEFLSIYPGDNPAMSDFASSSFFVDRGFPYRCNCNLERYVRELGGGLIAVWVTNLYEISG